MNEVVYVWKPLGLTPFQLVERFKVKYPEYKKEIVSYAGRLDPMAEGILILLIGDENKNRDKYLGFNKEYDAEVIIGISTDTFDSLGLITYIKFNEVSKIDIENKLQGFIGKHKQIYPPYSSKTVQGKSLFWWARENKLDQVVLPEREIEIFSIDLLDYKKVRIKELLNNVIKEIGKIDGNFRQDKILKSWMEFNKENSEKEVTKIKIKISCTSGTYIRRIASDLGKELNSEAFAYSIRRVRIGDMQKKDCIRIS